MQNETRTSTRIMIELYAIVGGCILVTIGALGIASTVSPIAFGLTAFMFGLFWATLIHQTRHMMKINRLKMIMKKKHQEADNRMFQVIEEMIDETEQQKIDMQALLEEGREFRSSLK